MDGSRARLLDPVLSRVPTLRKAAPASGPTRITDQLTAAWSLVLGVGWPLAFMIAVAVEPVPADPEAAAGPLLVQLAGLAFLVALGVTVVGAATRHASAAAAGVVTGLLATAFSITCPVSGHHSLGLWWFVQIGVTLAMLGASVVALGDRARVTS